MNSEEQKQSSRGISRDMSSAAISRRLEIVGQAWLDNPGPVEHVSVDWLPDSELEEVPLAQVVADDPLQGPDHHVTLFFELLLQGYSGRTYWRVADSVRVDPQQLRRDDSVPELWRKRAPISLSYRFTIDRGTVVPVGRR